MILFLTGASGYVGRHIAEEFLARGHAVIGMARGPSERTEYSPGIEWCFADLAAFDDYRALIQRCDCVIHCAMDYSRAGSENSDLDSAFVANLGGSSQHVIYTSNLFNPRLGPSDFLEESEASNETNWRFKNESLVLNSITDSAVIRLGFVYGGKGGYLWELLSAGTVFGVEHQEVADVFWPMVDVRDVGSLYATVAESRVSGVFHACDGSSTKARDVIDSLREIYRKKGVSSSATDAYAARLLGKSVQTTNSRSRLAGWIPQHETFLNHVFEAFDEHHDD